MAAATPQASLALRNVLIASDFSPSSESALLHAVSIAHHYGSTLHFAYVVQPALFSMSPPDSYMATPEAEEYAMDLARADARKLVSDVLHRTHCDDIENRVWVNLGPVGETLCAIIEREHIDLAVVGTHGRTGLRKLVMGSAAEDVFRHASCPVLTVGPHCWRSDPHAPHLKHVLFPTDLSPDSARALPIALAIVSRFDARFTVLHVVEHLDSEAAHDRRRVVSVLEQRMHEMVSAAGPMPAGISFEVQFGQVTDCVVEAASRLDVNLVAFGLKAPETQEDRLPWMHAYKIVCEVGCPVLSLRGPRHTL
jgi:nucleotide-binding universal stress UspA family protein